MGREHRIQSKSQSLDLRLYSTLPTKRMSTEQSAWMLYTRDPICPKRQSFPRQLDNGHTALASLERVPWASGQGWKIERGKPLSLSYCLLLCGMGNDRASSTSLSRCRCWSWRVGSPEEAPTVVRHTANTILPVLQFPAYLGVGERCTAFCRENDRSLEGFDSSLHFHIGPN
ncbi:hypothetical protein BJ742DRAFT_265295 [Cladochytrium replicatum]|nr:hypothetical protein BJ742DRAFT_265295 [Cladochytrium replicatum]